MADANPSYAIRKVTVDNVSWTPLVASIDCYSFAIYPNGDVKMRTDSADPNTEITIQGGSIKGVVLPVTQPPPGGTPAPTYIRFPKTFNIAYFQMVSGTEGILVEFIL